MSSHSQPRVKRLVVGITGRIGSGKTTVGRYLESTYGFQYLRYSEVLADWLAKDPESKAQLQKVGWDVMAGGMQVELNRRLVEQITPDSDVAVDGLRHKLDYETLNACFSTSFTLLYLQTDAKERFERLKRLGKYTDRNSFEASDNHPVEQHIESLRTDATALIQNNLALRDLYASVDEFILSLRKEGWP
jgi:dephospho-CoA kinase